MVLLQDWIIQAVPSLCVLVGTRSLGFGSGIGYVEVWGRVEDLSPAVAVSQTPPLRATGWMISDVSPVPCLLPQLSVQTRLHPRKLSPQCNRVEM